MIGLNYADIIEQINTVCPDTFRYVSYAITPQQVNWLASNPAYPAAFISPGNKETESNDVKSPGDLRQWVTEHFSVLVLVGNEGDMLAQDTVNSIPMFREKLRSALVNWHPLPLTRTVKAIEEGSDNMFMYEGGARAGWLYDYSLTYQIVTEDCYTPTPTPNAAITEITTRLVEGEG